MHLAPTFQRPGCCPYTSRVATSSRRRPTLTDLAAELGVSPSAVSLALNGRPGVSDALRKRVVAAAARRGYRPDPAAVALRTRRSGVLGLLIRNLQNPFFLDVIDGFDHECAQHGYEVMVGSARYDHDREAALANAFAGRQLDGLALAPIGDSKTANRWVRNTGKPVVLLNADAPRSRQIMTVSLATHESVRLAVEHLAGLGHRRIGLIAAPTGIRPEPRRSQVFAEEMKRRRLSGRLIETGLTLDSAIEAVRTELGRAPTRRPTAIISTSDYLAQSVYLAARDCKLRIPRDLSVVGHDNLTTSALLDPALTSIDADRAQIGVLAARLLIEAVEGGTPEDRHPSVPVELIVRGSTARLRST